MTGPVFRAGWHAERAEFRSTDANGRPVDPAAETDTARTDRIRALQDRRLAEGGRAVPSAEPTAVLTEWMAQSAANRMSGLSQWVAEHGRLPVSVEMEPLPGRAPGEPGGAPRPGGLLSQMRAMRMGRGSAG